MKHMQDFTHFNEQGRAKMVNVGDKPESLRTAVASGRVTVNESTFALIKNGGMKKGDVLAVAQFAVVGAEVLNSVGVDAKAVVAADEDGFSADVAGQRVDGGDEGQRRDNDLIPAGDADGHSGQMQRAGTGVAGHGAGHAHVGGQCFLKLGDFAAAGGDPAGGDSLTGKLCFAGAEIRDRKRNKFRHNTASQHAGP